MTVRELIKALENVSEYKKDKEILFYSGDKAFKVSTLFKGHDAIHEINDDLAYCNSEDTGAEIFIDALDIDLSA